MLKDQREARIAGRRAGPVLVCRSQHELNRPFHHPRHSTRGIHKEKGLSSMEPTIRFVGISNHAVGKKAQRETLVRHRFWSQRASIRKTFEVKRFCRGEGVSDHAATSGTCISRTRHSIDHASSDVALSPGQE